MIVRASSETGDLVVDPFCGSGTTLHAARDLRRRYVGIDASFSAAKATLRRMRHGLEPMGDYVNGKKPLWAKLPLVAIDERSAPCAFISDSRLLDTYSDAIREIGAI